MNRLSWIIAASLFIWGGQPANAAENSWVKKLQIEWTNGKDHVPLTFNENSEDWKPRIKSIREQNPQTGKMERLRGYHLSTVINNYLESIPYVRSANVDLVVVEGADKTSRIPRAFLNKYPVLLVGSSNRRVVLPRRSSRDILSEPLPINEYETEQVVRIRLTSYELEYGQQFFVNADGNPLAERGNKRFVQACLGCHFQKGSNFIDKMMLSKATSTLGGDKDQQTGISRGLSSDWKLKPTWHNNVQGYPLLDAMDQDGIRKYLDLLLRNSNGPTSSLQTVKSDTAWRETF